MRDVLIIFMLLLVLLVIISALGGSMRFGGGGGGGGGHARWNGAEYFVDGKPVGTGTDLDTSIGADGKPPAKPPAKPPVKIPPPPIKSSATKTLGKAGAAKFTQADDDDAEAEADDKPPKASKVATLEGFDGIEGFEQGSKSFAKYYSQRHNK
jgi:hypothetical protein